MKIKFAKFLMNCYSNEPIFDIYKPHGEIQNHNDFTKLDTNERLIVLEKVANRHYLLEKKYPFDRYYEYFGLNLSNFMRGKKILELGCAYGGKAYRCSEKWKPREYHGIDINDDFIDAANIFCKNKQNSTKFSFSVASGEKIPREDNSMDCIFSFDVLEHVQSVDATLSECYRVLKKGGFLFLVFPSYYMPTESHLGHITKLPCIHWFFDPKTLNIAYNQIIEDRGDQAYWYYKKGQKGYDWAKLHGGIGINGTTLDTFENSLKKIKFQSKKILLPPIFSVGKTSIKNKKTFYLSYIFRSLAKTRLFADFLSQRIVTVIRK